MGAPRGIAFSPLKGLHLSDDLSLDYLVTATRGMSANALKERLRADLKAAMRERRTDEVRLDAHADRRARQRRGGGRASAQTFDGSRAFGDPSGEVARREIDAPSARRGAAQRKSRRALAAAEDYERHGRAEEAARLRQRGRADRALPRLAERALPTRRGRSRPAGRRGCSTTGRLISRRVAPASAARPCRASRSAVGAGSSLRNVGAAAVEHRLPPFAAIHARSLAGSAPSFL